MIILCLTFEQSVDLFLSMGELLQWTLQETWGQGQLSIHTAKLSLEQVGRVAPKVGVVIVKQPSLTPQVVGKSLHQIYRIFHFVQTTFFTSFSYDFSSSWQWVESWEVCANSPENLQFWCNVPKRDALCHCTSRCLSKSWVQITHVRPGTFWAIAGWKRYRAWLLTRCESHLQGT